MGAGPGGPRGRAAAARRPGPRAGARQVQPAAPEVGVVMMTASPAFSTV